VSALQTVEQWEALRHGRVQAGFLYDPPADADLVCGPLWQQEITLVPGSADTAPRPGIALRRPQEIDFGVQVFAAHEGGRTSWVTGAFLGEMRGSLEEWNAMPPRSQTGT
jgi:DNA-binding transcriptional LysR family regulator